MSAVEQKSNVILKLLMMYSVVFRYCASTLSERSPFDKKNAKTGQRSSMPGPGMRLQRPLRAWLGASITGQQRTELDVTCS
jgi:hypothetical protein